MGIISNGTTILDNGAFSVGLGSMVLLSEQTASGASSVQFTSGIDSTYPIYRIDIINAQGSANDKNFQINFSSDGGSNYNVVKTTTGFVAEHGEDGSPSGSLFYNTFLDVAQSTGNQTLGYNGGTDSGDSTSGTVYLFNPSSTTFVKHFISHTNIRDYTNDLRTLFVAGYLNTTSAVDAVRFTFISANVDDGIFKLYGIKDS